MRYGIALSLAVWTALLATLPFGLVAWLAILAAYGVYLWASIPPTPSTLDLRECDIIDGDGLYKDNVVQLRRRA